MLLFLDIDNVLLLPGKGTMEPAAIAALDDARRRGFTFVLHSALRHRDPFWAAELFRVAGHRYDHVVGDDPSKREAIIAWLDEQALP